MYIGIHNLKIKEKGKGKKTKALPLSNLLPVVGVDNLGGYTIAHNRIEHALL
jgi:hypothetical protein